MAEDHGYDYHFVVYRVDLYQLEGFPERARKYEDEVNETVAHDMDVLRMAAENTGTEFNEADALRDIENSAPLRENPWDLLLKIKEVFKEEEHAAEEVARLNALNIDKECRYFYQGCRFYPDGRKSQQDREDDDA